MLQSTKEKTIGFFLILIFIVVLIGVFWLFGWTGFIDTIKEFLETPLTELEFRHIVLLAVIFYFTFHKDKK